MTEYEITNRSIMQLPFEIRCNLWQQIWKTQCKNDAADLHVRYNFFFHSFSVHIERGHKKNRNDQLEKWWKSLTYSCIHTESVRAGERKKRNIDMNDGLLSLLHMFLMTIWYVNLWILLIAWIRRSANWKSFPQRT